MFKSLSLTLISVILGCFFIFVGLSKATPIVNSYMYENWKEEFGRYNKVFPLYSTTRWRPLAKNYRFTVGLLETICGLILLLIPNEKLKYYATMVLMFIMAGALYTHYYLKDNLEMKMPSILFGFLLICRLIISYLADKRERVENEYERMRKLIQEDESEMKND